MCFKMVFCPCLHRKQLATSSPSRKGMGWECRIGISGWELPWKTTPPHTTEPLLPSPDKAPHTQQPVLKFRDTEAVLPILQQFHIVHTSRMESESHFHTLLCVSVIERKDLQVQHLSYPFLKQRVSLFKQDHLPSECQSFSLWSSWAKADSTDKLKKLECCNCLSYITLCF